ncbi:xylulokinase [Paeniglutamicibacter sulfureus]|uniref:Xylulose kinase n=1 Tax=Paeniglutamicibacter sulfureus TaxID=43666 RepID=A0ABU2BHJ4_9MICC|nr:xylulokinase [Paeniglutamicibacter sulfureus]MDO2933641.1 xylulokinase [Paeniglutamicibacter sulfureus]MDR7358065.1 xylulokinase [Paeniglutamicibacter sulfureus]
MSRTVIAGIDSSTQSTKVLRVDAETGEILSKTSAPHPDGTSVNPERWWEALASQGDLDDVAALSVSAQQHGMVALDASGTPVHDALLWNDTRSAPQAKALREALGAESWAREIGIVPVPSFTVTKLAWLAENHPELADRVDQVMLPHDWLTWRLAGRPETATTDRSDASGTGYYSVPEGRYRDDILRLAFGRSPRLPRVLAPAEAAGRTSSGALIAAGCGDNAGAALGLGLVPGEVVISIGTSGTVFAPSAARIQDPSGAVAGFADATGHNLPLLATINAARTLSASSRMLNVDLDELDALASAGAPDAGGLTLIPYLDGERTPDLPHATGTMTGLTRANLTPENMARASVLGLLCTLSDALERLRAQGVSAKRIVLIGGGSMSRSVRRAAAEIFDTEVVVPPSAEYVALGAARQAAWALSGATEPPTWTRSTEQTYEPTGASWAAEVRGRFTAARIATYGI